MSRDIVDTLRAARLADSSDAARSLRHDTISREVRRGRSRPRAVLVRPR